jgi:excisionase family DNA binding protein
LNEKFEKILAEPTASVPEAGMLLGLARNASYDAAKRGEIPTLRFGGKLRVPTAALRKLIQQPDAAVVCPSNEKAQPCD